MIYKMLGRTINNVKIHCVWTGLWGNIASISDAISCGHSERGRWSSPKTRLHPSWKGMARDGRFGFQLLALVDPQRRLSSVGLPYDFCLYYKFIFMRIFFVWRDITEECHVICRWDLIQDGATRYQDMDRLVAFYKGLTTWGRWVDLNVDPTKTKVFFQGISPTHYL